jgi:hypothetical protein
VPVCRAREVPDAASKKNAIGVGISATESQPVLAK